MRKSVRRVARNPILIAVIAALLLVVFAAPAAAQTAADDENVLVSIGGDLSVPAGDSNGVVVVVDGTLDMEGSAGTVVIVGGEANLVGATIETLVVVDGTADLGAGTRITGDVHLVDSNIVRDPGATVEGTVQRGTGDISTEGFWIIGLVFMLGWAMMMLLAALILAAVAPGFARRTGRTITNELGPTLLAGLILWIALPMVSMALLATFIGIPAAITIMFVVLPAVGLIGFLVSAVRVGEYITGGTEGVGHPYLAGLVGTAILLAVGAIPVLGPISAVVAGFVGSGAIALQAARSIQSEPPAPAPPTPVEAQPEAEAVAG